MAVSSEKTNLAVWDNGHSNFTSYEKEGDILSFKNTDTQDLENGDTAS